ncbi:hypothetical protein EH165_07085 [Nakamurella antarctica]|uniref:Lon N-terminal domain-containing protein n=1 Tax=Nakamurella antarctica TaxID=1902245 RepID=A0A3G8ZL61_9ACTN|nr:LON peptidase substrate-binding domain-containing protein [Nakamurella antarctica]AZI57940.1 hypothetical protein EH165_07085 [Nakamurella antarctica]
MPATSLPLFPLGTALFPGVALPLNIFEPRYRNMVRELMEQPAESRQFGVVAIKAGREVGINGIDALHEIGCTARIQHVEAYADGGLEILAVGATRFKLVSTDTSDALVRGEVEYLADSFSPGAAALVGPVSRRFVNYRDSLLAAQGLEMAEGSSLPTDATRLSYLVASAMILDLVEKQELLACADAEQRLRLELQLLRRESAMFDQLSTRPGVELSSEPYSTN